MLDDHKHNEISKENSLGVSFLLNLVTGIFQIVGGLFSGSLSLLSDALHNLSDAMALVISLFAERLSKKENTESKTFGYKRAEILAALFNACMLVVVSFFLFKEAFVRFANPYHINSSLMLAIASVGLIANLISVFLLKSHAHSSLNIKAAYLHLFSDFLSSIAIILGAILIYVFKAYWIDPALTVFIGIYVLFSGYKIIEESINILMQNTPKNISLNSIGIEIEKFDNVKNVHHAHIWAVTEKDIHLEAHINLLKDIPVSETCKLYGQIEKMLKERFSIYHTTLQFEVNSCEGVRLVKN